MCCSFNDVWNRENRVTRLPKRFSAHFEDPPTRDDVQFLGALVPGPIELKLCRRELIAALDALRRYE